MATKRTVRYFVAPYPVKKGDKPRHAVMQEYVYQDRTGIALLLSYTDKGVADGVAKLLNGAKRSEK